MDDRLVDGRRIAELLASEIEGHEELGLSVVDADPDVEPTPGGALAYRVAREADTEDGANGSPDVVAAVYLQSDRVRVEFVTAQAAVADAADTAGLRVRPKAVRPPRTLVFVEDGAEVKRAVAAFEAAVQND